MAGLSTRITDSNKKFNPHLHIRKHADEDFLCTQQYFHRKSSSYLSPIHQDVTPTKMSPPPHSLQNHFLFSPRPPIHSKSASRTTYQNSKRNAITQTPTPKASKKAIPRPPSTKTKSKPIKKTIQKQSIKLHQLENTPTQTAIQIHPESAQTSLKTHTPQNARTFSPKRKCVLLQTPKSLLPNAKAFHLKHKYI